MIACVQVAAEPRLTGLFHELSVVEGSEVYLHSPTALGLPLQQPISWEQVRGRVGGCVCINVGLRTDTACGLRHLESSKVVHTAAAHQLGAGEWAGGCVCINVGLRTDTACGLRHLESSKVVHTAAAHQLGAGEWAGGCVCINVGLRTDTACGLRHLESSKVVHTAAAHQLGAGEWAWVRAMQSCRIRGAGFGFRLTSLDTGKR